MRGAATPETVVNRCTAASAMSLPPQAGTPGHVRVLAPRRALAWHVFFGNAAVLVGVFLFYVLTPATISSPVGRWELPVLVVAIAVSLFLNLLLLDRAFAPLDELHRLMERVDPLHPGRRIQLSRGDSDVAALADTFNEMLDRLETERRESARRALLAQEDERRRVARELHDELGQILTGVLLLLDEAARAREARSREAIEEAREAARSSLDEVGRIVRDLRPDALDELGLASAMAAMASAFERQTGVALDRRLPARFPRLTDEQEVVVYRTAQEALTNVARHAGAGRVTFSAEQRYGELRMIVRDDGRGFEGEPPDDGGIQGMHERALLAHGRVNVRSARGEGTEVVLSVPLGEP